MTADALREFAEAGDEDLTRLLQRASRSINAQLMARLDALGYDDVRPAHAAVFMNLDAEGTRIVVLAQRAEMTRQAMSPLVKDLETAGYVRVDADPTDGRAVTVSLTPRGERFCHEASRVMVGVEAEWTQRLGASGLRSLRESLRTLIAIGQPAD